MENREIVHRGHYNMDVCSGQADIYGNREKAREHMRQIREERKNSLGIECKIAEN